LRILRIKTNLILFIWISIEMRLGPFDRKNIYRKYDITLPTLLLSWRPFPKFLPRNLSLAINSSFSSCCVLFSNMSLFGSNICLFQFCICQLEGSKILSVWNFKYHSSNLFSFRIWIQNRSNAKTCLWHVLQKKLA
jgi:hypothetical protein